MEKEKLPSLAAHCDEALSVEAARQLIEMTEDTSMPTHKGEDLPPADKAALLRKAKLLQQSR